jgi:hypothetical protein
MPVIMVSDVKFENNRYRIDLHELVDIFPHISEGKNWKLYLIEVRNEKDKLVKRFKPFKELELKTIKYWDLRTQCYLDLPADVASQFNIGKDYRVVTILTAYDGRPFLPLELKYVGYGSERVFEYFSKIEAELLLLSLEQPLLNKATSYLWNAYFRLEENDIEGARTSVRNSLEVLGKELVDEIKVIEKSEESESLPQKLEKLIKDLTEFMHYGGPHPGPTPRSTTEMVILMVIELIRYLAKALESRVISLRKGD